MLCINLRPAGVLVQVLVLVHVQQQYMTLGPKFFSCSNPTTARRPMGLFSRFFVQIVAFFSEIVNLISKRDLKPSGRKFACGLGFGSYVLLSNTYAE